MQNELQEKREKIKYKIEGGIVMGFFGMYEPLGGDCELPFQREQRRKEEKEIRKATERTIGKISPSAGKILETINNVEDTLENASNATNPIRRIGDKLKSYTCEEARQKLKKGNHIYVNRSVYSHHGIYDGYGSVYEYQDGNITINSLEVFADGDGILVKDEPAAYSPNEIIRRAQMRLGEEEYNLLYNNCENYATWCRCGMKA